MHAPSPMRCCTRATCSTRTAPTRERTSRAGSSACWGRRAPRTPASVRMTRCPRRCWLRSNGVPSLSGVARFLQLQHRGAERDVGGGRFEQVDELDRGLDRRGSAGTRRVEREITMDPFAVTSLPRTLDISVPGGHRHREPWTAGDWCARAVRCTVNSTSPRSADGDLLRLDVRGAQHRATRRRQGRGDRDLADRHAPAHRSRRRRVRVAARTAGFRRRRGGAVQRSTAASRCSRGHPANMTWCWCSPIILYDHPEIAEQSKGRAVRLHRDRRDPHAAGHDDDRRGEGAGARHRSAGGPDHRPRATRCRRRRCWICTACCAIRTRRARTRADTRDPRGRRLVGSVGGQRGTPDTRRRSWSTARG